MITKTDEIYAFLTDCTTLARSPHPENPANCEGEDWEESEQICPDCGQLVWTASWWDDSSDCGGSAIGTLFKCGNCGYQDSI